MWCAVPVSGYSDFAEARHADVVLVMAMRSTDCVHWMKVGLEFVVLFVMCFFYSVAIATSALGFSAWSTTLIAR